MKTIISIVLKSVLVGVGYLVALMLSGLLLRLAGMNMPQATNIPAQMIWLFAGGVIVGLFLGPIAAMTNISRMKHWLVWASVIFFNNASVAIEGRFFAPDLVEGRLAALLIQQFLVSLATSWLLTKLFAPVESVAPIGFKSRSWFSWLWRFILSAFSYVVFYFVFGALNFALVTKPYYATHVGGLTVPAPLVVLMVELIRAPLIVLSVLPFLLTTQFPKKQTAIYTGLILFSIGGLFPLTARIGVLPFLLLAASAVEIFFQNYPTGVVTARLLGRETHK